MDYSNYSMPARDRFEEMDALASEAAVYTVADEPEEALEYPDAYTVKPGDTYQQIASMLGSTVYEIGAMNPYVDPDALEVGQQLRVPSYGHPAAEPMDEAGPVNAQPQLGLFPAAERPEAAPPPMPVQPAPMAEAVPAPIPAPAPPAPEGMEGCSQLVLPNGWDFTNILMRYGISYRALESANPGMDVFVLRPGQSLRIPPTGTRGHILSAPGMRSHTIERQDTIESIARRYGTSVAMLFRENPVLAPDDFVSGRVISIPQ